MVGNIIGIKHFSQSLQRKNLFRTRYHTSLGMRVLGMTLHKKQHCFHYTTIFTQVLFGECYDKIKEKPLSILVI